MNRRRFLRLAALAPVAGPVLASGALASSQGGTVMLSTAEYVSSGLKDWTPVNRHRWAAVGRANMAADTTAALRSILDRSVLAAVGPAASDVEDDSILSVAAQMADHDLFHPELVSV